MVVAKENGWTMRNLLCRSVGVTDTIFERVVAGKRYLLTKVARAAKADFFLSRKCSAYVVNDANKRRLFSTKDA